jgi:hypothetical protein
LTYCKTVHHLLIDFKKATDSVRREVLYNILIEYGVVGGARGTNRREKERV